MSEEEQRPVHLERGATLAITLFMTLSTSALNELRGVTVVKGPLVILSSLQSKTKKFFFQNKRAKLKKASGERPVLALHLMAQGLYNHTASGLAHV